MKYIYTTLILLLWYRISVSQDTKTYSGPYEGGKATYQYYETKDLERVFHGTFNYVPDAILGEGKITGRFFHDKKDGTWTSSTSYPDGWFLDRKSVV